MNPLALLAEHAPGGPPFHRRRVFRWELRLDRDGRVVDLADHLENPLTLFAPSVKRTVGIIAQPACDTAGYTFGTGARGEKCKAAAAAQAIAWADSTGDPAAVAVARFHASGARPPLPETLQRDQNVLITVDGTPACLSPSAAGFWSAVVERQKGVGTWGLCIVCAGSGPLTRTMPDSVPASLLPGATAPAVLCLAEDLAQAPICLPCADAATSGLSRALADERRSVCCPGSRSRTAWWITGAAGDTVDPMQAVMYPDRDRVGMLMDGEVDVPDGARFRAITVSGNVSRISIREVVDMPLSLLVDRVAQWFADMSTDTVFPDDHPWPQFAGMLAVLGRWDGRRYQNPRVPADAQELLLRSIIHGDPVAPRLTTHLLRQMRADGRVSHARVAVLQAHDRRAASSRQPEQAVH
ncbi:type I-C CRISPR-associated protein Cas8c/Csd1 [Nocardia sp. alder85J]|uniref:type I-C CRISPR-associated protein Cas8c/Csd1 n=1 Tax=Nocardia sp. alder85J TaxID=2862949 RepID=UPI001CD54FE0|nr:type I-C CRISPR-associated protein Cas8c/Csd1 [Nocardia sp. alder85J]MCX4097730.1 type I-C CRISPR-associated protein Cas8c/Csd1 [Nocardia sp. alder85J]